MSNPETSNEGPGVVVIGAGVGGLAFGINLKRQLKYENFIIYEKASDVGGTWRDNVYPGCSSDVPMAFYSLSTDPHDWSSSHGSQEDILGYWQSLTEKYQIYQHIVFDRKIVDVIWNNSSQLYTVVVEDSTGKQIKSVAKIVISAVGVLEAPRFANIPGISSFKGDLFHSARWNKSVDLRGKRVAVVGNGASSTQFVPILTEDPKVEVTQFCRTPNWFLPPIRTTHSPITRWILWNIPFIIILWRWWMFFRLEVFYFTIFGVSFLRPVLQKVAKAYIRKEAPEEHISDLIPTYPLGCKRVIFDTNFLSSLHRPNHNLNWDGVDSVVENGILTNQGESLPFDVLIFATGFAADIYPVPVSGKFETIQEYYKAKGGAQAYLGTTVPGFPNFFMLLGPNTATGHTSVLYTTEIQVDYIIQLIKPIVERHISTVEVKADPTDRYNEKIHGLLNKSLFTQCLSWYRVGGDGKITNIFPGSGTTFWWWLRNPNWDHFTGAGMDTWRDNLRRNRFTSIIRNLCFVCLMILVCWKYAPHEAVLVMNYISGNFSSANSSRQQLMFRATKASS